MNHEYNREIMWTHNPIPGTNITRQMQTTHKVMVDLQRWAQLDRSGAAPLIV